MSNYLKEAKNSLVKIKSQIAKNIESGQKKIQITIDKYNKALKKSKDVLQKSNKNLKLAKTVAAKKKFTVHIKKTKKNISEIEKSLALLKAKQQHLRDLLKLSKKAVKPLAKQKSTTSNNKTKTNKTSKVKKNLSVREVIQDKIGELVSQVG